MSFDKPFLSMFPYVCEPQETLQLVQTQKQLSRKQKCLPTNSEAFWWREQFHMFRRFLRHFQHEKHCLPARLYTLAQTDRD